MSAPPARTSLQASLLWPPWLGQVLRGNIRVLVRVRPPVSGARCAVAFPLEGALSVQDAASQRQREFEFDAVFGPAADQGTVFQEVGGQAGEGQQE